MPFLRGQPSRILQILVLLERRSNLEQSTPWGGAGEISAFGKGRILVVLQVGSNLVTGLAPPTSQERETLLDKEHPGPSAHTF